jgi:Fic family protein
MNWNWQQPNWPEWYFDPNALNMRERQFLLQSGQLIGAWQHLGDGDRTQLKVELLSDEAMKSSAIEGEYLDRNSVQSSVRQQFGMTADQPAGPAESGIAELMVACFERVGDPLTHKTLAHWHTLVCRGRTNLKIIGGYRQHPEPMQVVSGAIYRPKIHFEAPPSSQVSAEMIQFLEWFSATDLPALTKAGLAHLSFVSVHPFEDGNGRIARTLSEKALAEALGQPSLLALSREIEKHRKAYYDALEANNKELDVTDWLVWFADCVLQAQNYSQNLIVHLIAKAKLFERLRGRLNKRQEKVLLRMFDAGPEGFEGGLSAQNYRSITRTTPATARRDLGDLVSKEALRRTGERKGTRYWLTI